jgi:hypothetical protein
MPRQKGPSVVSAALLIFGLLASADAEILTVLSITMLNVPLRDSCARLNARLSLVGTEVSPAYAHLISSVSSISHPYR